jgi:hypothetical protein
MDSDLGSDLLGMEWDFLAVDSAGQVAVLSTAGEGPIPAPVLAAREDVELAVAQLQDLLATTSAVPADPDQSGNYSEWFDLSARGLYAYDWTAMTGGYELISAPAQPAQLELLPEPIRAAATLVRSSQLFAGSFTLRLP